MPEEWREVALNDVIDLRLSSVDKKSKANEHGVQLCNYTDVYKNSFINANMDFMSATATEREIAKCSLFPGDVVITKDSEKYDDIGVPALVREEVPNLVCGYHLAILRPCSPEIDGPYLFYALSVDDTQRQFHSYANGITRFSLRKSDIGLVKIPLPPLPEQRAIAQVLGSLDDKIELNRRMNETLEGMARALFKSWFVDFDPVRAKMEGRDPGLPPDLAALFPARLAASDLGDLPAGWRAGALGDIAGSSRRGVSPADLPPDTPYIGLEHMPRRSIALIRWDKANTVTSSKWAFVKGDLLFGRLRSYFYKVGVAPVDGICSTDIAVLSPKGDAWSAFVLLSISTDAFIEYTDQTSTGTRMPRTSWKTMSGYEICLPASEVVAAFQRMAQPMIDKIIANIHESRALAALRDALLPRLVSGAVRVGGDIAKGGRNQ